MSVIVMGMEMPTNCALCDCSFGALCYVSPAEVNGYCPGHGRPEWCPLVELPEKHGRLIDAEAFKAMCRETVADLRETVFLPHEKKMVEQLADATEALCLDLDEAPTIVEAEGGREP